MQLRKCQRCQQEFMAHSMQKYCGSRSKKIGCAWLVRQEFEQARRKSEYYKEYWHTPKGRQIKRDNKRKHRSNKDAYYERQLISSIQSRDKEAAKEYLRIWKDNHPEKVKEYSRRERNKRNQVIGSHTNSEWHQVKKQFGFRCAVCGITELELSILWAGTKFTNLTEDHIIPISKGGSDYIDNIRPTCISCNDKRNNKDIVKLRGVEEWVR